MNFLQNLSIRSKLIIASLVPLLALLYYLQINIRQELVNKESAQQVIGDVSEIGEISKVIHEFQKERALSLTYLISNGIKGKDQLSSQREATDRVVFSLGKILKEQNRSIENYNVLDSLSPIRARVDALKPIKDIDPFYSGYKMILLEEISKILRASKNLTLKNSFEEHLFLLYTKDFLAQIRSQLGSVLTAGKFEGREYGDFASVKGKHEINMQKFRKTASPELKDFFDKKFQGPYIQQTYTIIDSAYNNPTLANFKYNFDTWWEVATSSINSLKEVEDYSSDIISNKANAELLLANANVTRNGIIAILIISLIILIVTSTIRGIVNAINSIKEAADKMVKGDVNVTLDIKTKDEIGELATSFTEMISGTKDFADIADTIGKGDYSPVIKIRSESDTLGIALDNMKNNLQKLSKDNEIRTWLLTGNSELNDKMRGEKEVKNLAQDVIIQLTTYLKAQIGAIYLSENGQFTLVGSYAFHHRKDNANSFKPGQGLVGQAALEKKPILFSDIPDDYIKINSGLGNVIPKSIIVFPFLYDGEVFQFVGGRPSMYFARWNDQIDFGASAPLLLLSPQFLPGGGFELQVDPGGAGNYVIEASVGFAGWLPLVTNGASVTSFADPGASGFTSRFYRARAYP